MEVTQWQAPHHGDVHQGVGSQAEVTVGVGKNIPSKEIPSGTGYPLVKTKDMLEDKNNKQVLTSAGGPFKKEEMLKD